MRVKSAPFLIAVCVPDDVSRRAKILSAKLKKHGGLYVLDKKHIPHLTLYMTEFPLKNLKHVKKEVHTIVQNFDKFILRSAKYRNSQLGYIDISYHRARSVLTLQTRLITELNPLREGLITSIERRRLNEATKKQRDNLIKYGYDGVGKFFTPHVTLSKLRIYDNHALSTLPKEKFSFTVEKIGLFKQGPHNTCRELICTYSLKK